MATLVVDVSVHNGRIDWAKAKTKIDGAILRLGYGDDVPSQDDGTYLYNVSECERLGIPYGVYIYSYAADTNQVQSEINHTLRQISGHNPVIGVFLDLEENNLGYLAKTASQMFCDQINAKGYKAGIYCGAFYYKSYLVGMYERLKALWWIAGYGTNSGLPEPNFKPNPGFNYQAWQYTSNGMINGIPTRVDLSQWYVPFSGEAKPVTPDKKVIPHISYECRNAFGYTYSGKDGSAATCQNAMTAIKIGVDVGSVEYRVHCNGRWLPKVTGNDWNNYENGYAGDDVHAIDALQIYYISDASKSAIYEAVYAVKPFGMGWLPEVKDTNWEEFDGDFTAGMFDYNIESVKIKLEEC